MGGQCGVDTNVLLRYINTEQVDYPMIAAALRALSASGTTLCYTAQNIAELWNVCTRPAEHNGFGYTLGETERNVRSIERAFQFLPDSFGAYQEWRRVVVDHAVRGAAVHDARLAAVLRQNQVKDLLTFNVADFKRYPFLRVIHPQEVLAG